jgi:bifunctional DNase/RNase
MTARFLPSALLFLALGCSTSGPAPSDEVGVHIGELSIDPTTDSPVLVLSEDGGERTLSLWIGFPEASSIAEEMQQIHPERPNTHDLLQHVIAELGGHVERVVVTELRGGTYYAVLRVQANGKLMEIDARPSDAIAVALRVAAPLFVRESLFEKSKEEPTGNEAGQETRYVPKPGPGEDARHSAASLPFKVPERSALSQPPSAAGSNLFFCTDVCNAPATSFRWHVIPV